ncbi:hypothetical protein MMC13_004752 [Lambiella insularis]|nr:hypothetical protein [Lambiella insularis]
MSQEANETETNRGDGEELWCVCRGVEGDGIMAECCNAEQCHARWFHLECVGIKVRPTVSDEWYCQDCVDRGIGHARRWYRQSCGGPQLSLAAHVQEAQLNPVERPSLGDILKEKEDLAAEEICLAILGGKGTFLPKKYVKQC